MKFLHKLNYVLLILCLSCTAYANEVKEEKRNSGYGVSVYS